MEITIKNNTYKIKYGFKALMIYERIEGASFQPTSISNIITFFYCCLLATNSDITFEEFIDYLDENEEAIEEFSNYLNNVIEAKTLKKAKGSVTEK